MRPPPHLSLLGRSLRCDNAPFSNTVRLYILAGMRQVASDGEYLHSRYPT
nr:TPA_asm: m107 uORF RNA *1 [Murid betaherpesvirus 1]DBA07880.1 TPA_asm: m107 uORF RNA *1 [Murid betaherpesvirus 1]